MSLDTANEAAEAPADAADSKKVRVWRAELNDNYCKLRKLDHPPVGYDGNGKLTFAKDAVSNPESYILWDTSRDAPPGFGLKVAGKKTYILRRKVMGKSMLAKVGNFADFEKIQTARAKAGELALAMVATGQNPNVMAREQNASEVTLKQAMLAYREHIVERTQRPAKPETLKVYDRVMRRHVEWKWADRKVREIDTDDIKKKFKETFDATPTATEQAFRWPARAINWYIENEKIRAEAQGREPRLKGNPFNYLAINNFYRTKDQIDDEREEKGKRNPLRPTQDLGRFLEACWSKKNLNDNMTGIHYLMLMLLWGCRKSEHAGLVWGELLSELGGPGIGRRSTSHVYMKDHPDWGPYVFFYKTKNGRSHRMPLTPMALELLKRRQGMTSAMHRLSQQAHEAFPTTIYYAFKQSDTTDAGTASTGWETFIDAVIRAGFVITGTWPMRTERAERMRGQESNALASSIVLVCRRRDQDAPSTSRREFIRELKDELAEAVEVMIGGSQGISPVAPVDLAQAVIGPGMAIFSKYSAVLEADGSPMTVHAALTLINRMLTEGADDFDADSQFCLGWFDEQGWDAGEFGKADVLARAKGTFVDHIKNAGVVEASGGKVRLLKPAEYPSDWTPENDNNTPVWEALHQMIRELRSAGETATGVLLAGMPQRADPIRNLAYRLYTLCERKGWAEDARAYNELITSWASIEAASHEKGHYGSQANLGI